MTHEEVIAMLEEIQVDGTTVPFAYSHFAENESPGPPFICFLDVASDNFFADNVDFFLLRVLDIELYTDRKDPPLEATVEAVLLDHELCWEKEETWIESEKLYEICYEVVV